MPTTFEWISFSLGTAGTALGLVTGFQQIVSNRVRLKLRSYPLTILRAANVHESYLCIEVMSIGSFPITVRDVGFELGGLPKGGRMIDGELGCIDGTRLPKRVEASDSLRVCIKWERAASIVETGQHVVVDTACGQTRGAKLDHLRQYARGTNSTG